MDGKHGHHMASAIMECDHTEVDSSCKKSRVQPHGNPGLNNSAAEVAQVVLTVMLNNSELAKHRVELLCRMLPWNVKIMLATSAQHSM